MDGIQHARAIAHYLGATLCRLNLKSQRVIPAARNSDSLGGERRTLRSVARYASHWNLPMFDHETLRHKRDVLGGHCADAGTDVDAIKVSTHVFAPADADPAHLVEAAGEQAEAGIDQAIVYFEPPVDLAKIDSVTEALAHAFG